MANALEQTIDSQETIILNKVSNKTSINHIDASSTHQGSINNLEKKETKTEVNKEIKP